MIGRIYFKIMNVVMSFFLILHKVMGSFPVILQGLHLVMGWPP